MGGRGSGGWYRYNKKNNPSDYWVMTMRKFKQWGLLEDGIIRNGTLHWSTNGVQRCNINYKLNLFSSVPILNVSYMNKTTKEDFDYNIRLEYTEPNYGGKRWWFICPLQGCTRRVGVLYLGKYFGCRHCYKLAYESQNESLAFRLQRRAFKIHERLGGIGGLDDYVAKPKGMHWKTYNKKMAELERFSNNSLIAIAAQIGVKPEDFEM